MSEAEDLSGIYPCKARKWRFSWRGGHTPAIQAQFIIDPHPDRNPRAEGGEGGFHLISGMDFAVWYLLQTQLLTNQPLNILVVDDEFGTRASLGIVLALAGHHAVFAKDGDEALELFENDLTTFDLVITDHQMFRLSGLDLARGLREKGFTGRIIVLTAYAGSIEEQEYQNFEVDGIMEKPFDIAELRHWVDCIH